MERLWTPWRMAYIKGEARHPGCVFCDMPAADPTKDRENLVLARGDKAFVIMNKYPYNAGHVLVATYRHEARYEELEPEEHAEMAEWTSRCIRALEREYKPQGYNVGFNMGTAAGAGIEDHLHLHVVPRWNGDTNYMTTVSDVKVLPETLEQTFDRLKHSLG